MKTYKPFSINFKKFNIIIDSPSKTYFKSIWQNKNITDDNLTSLSANIIHYQFYAPQEINSEILLHNKYFTQKYNEEFNALIKNMINHIDICNNRYYTKLLINKGLFKGMNIHIKLHSNNVSLTLKNISHKMKKIILSNYNILEKQLLDHEIKLKNIRFIGKEALSDNEHNSI